MEFSKSDFREFLVGKPYQFEDFNSWIFRNNFWAIKKGYDLYPHALKSANSDGIEIAEAMMYDSASSSLLTIPKFSTIDGGITTHGNIGIVKGRVYSVTLDDWEPDSPILKYEDVNTPITVGRMDFFCLVYDDTEKNIWPVYVLDVDKDNTATFPTLVKGNKYLPIAFITRQSNTAPITNEQIEDARPLFSV